MIDLAVTAEPGSSQPPLFEIAALSAMASRRYRGRRRERGQQPRLTPFGRAYGGCDVVGRDRRDRRDRRRRGAAVAWVGVALAAVISLSACQATMRVGVDVKNDGSGSIAVTAHLDRDAASFAPDVRTADLVKSGWKVVGPTPAANGGVDFTASKAFTNPAQARAVVSELSGPTGPFRNLVIASHRSFFKTTTSFQGSVDLSCGLTCFSDPQLQQALGGSPDLGIDSAKLQADAGIIVDRLFQFEVAARLPGAVQSSNAPSQVGNGAVWKVGLGQKAVLMAQARAWNVTHLAVVIVVAVLVLVAAGLVLQRRRSVRRRRARSASRHRASLGSRV